MKAVNRILDVILALIMMLMIISFSVVTTLNFKPLYYFDIDFLQIPEKSGYSEEVIRENYNVLIDYNNLWGAETLEFPSLAMSETGRIHFEEVKEVFGFFEILLIVTVILSIPLSIYCGRIRKDPAYLLLTGIFTVAIPSVAGVLIALNWERVFILFHEIVFNNDYWVFDPVTDPVITILPNEFFMHCAIMIVLISILGAIICIANYSRHKASYMAQRIKRLEGQQ